MSDQPEHIAEKDADWVPFDYDAKDANPLPDPWVTVWVHDEFYDGVTIGYWADGWWETFARKDDISVTHWMPVPRPEPPHGISPSKN